MSYIHIKEIYRYNVAHFDIKEEMKGKEIKNARELKLQEYIALFNPSENKFDLFEVVKRKFSTNSIVVKPIYKIHCNRYFGLVPSDRVVIPLPNQYVYTMANLPLRHKVEMEIYKRRAESTLCPAAQP